MKQTHVTHANTDQDNSQQIETVLDVRQGATWGGKLFLATFIAVLGFFWWLLIYSGGAVVHHG